MIGSRVLADIAAKLRAVGRVRPACVIAIEMLVDRVLDEIEREG